jgi:hypothetical protein
MTVFIVILILFCTLNIFISDNLVEVNEYELSLDKLPPEFKGFTILQMTDNHIKNIDDIKTDKDFFSTAEKKVSSQGKKIDIVVVTGDLQDRGDKIIPGVIEFMSQISIKYPVYFISGNHDYNPYFSKALKKAGINFLDNESVFLQRVNSKIWITGISDLTRKLDNEDKAFKDLSINDFDIVLTHEPNNFKEIVNYGGDIILCGHTHAGQIRLPFLPVLYAEGEGFFPTYGYGFYSEIGPDRGKALMYVSKGIGYTNPVPFRFFNRPEITIFTLQ